MADGTGQLDEAARAYRAAERALTAAMVEANEAGRSLRTIAAAAGYSHEKVRVILARERTRGATVEEPTHVAHEDPVSAQPPVGEFSRIQASLAKLREALTPPLSGLE